jgi:hypothetical protein
MRVGRLSGSVDAMSWSRPHRSRTLLVLLVASFLAVGLSPDSAAGQTQSRCAVLFPEAAWTSVPGASVDFAVSEVPAGQVTRFRDEVASIASAVGGEIGTLVDAAVCIVGTGSAFDASRYVTGVNRFHAVVDGDQGVVVLSSENPGNIRRAAAFGIPHLALWQQSNGRGWPEPLASTIAQWYRARSLDRMAQYRVEATGADFSADPLSGGLVNFGLDFSTDARIEWTEFTQAPVLVWDPERNESPIGYFIEYTVSEEGAEVLLDTEAEAWTDREVRWRTSLVQDLTGRTTPTTGWIVGVAVALAAVTVASVFAIHGFLSKRRRSTRA